MSGNKLFVGGLTTETDEDGLRKAFSRWSVRDAIIVYDRETRRSRGFGYVTFAYPKDAEEAMNCMGGESGKGKEIFGRVLNIDYAKDKERESGGGGRGGRGGFRGGRGGGPQMRGRGPPGPPRGPPGRGDPYARGPRDGPPPRGRRGGPPMRGPPPPGPPPRRGPPEREPLRESYKDRYDERGYGPPPDRSYRSHEYDRAPYERERERPAPYQSDRGYGEKYPPPARGYSSTDRSYGGPPPERQYSSSDRYGGSYGSSERSDYDSDRYNGAVRYPPSDRSYSSERPAAYDRGSSSYTSTAERSYATERSYPANDRAGYGPPPSRERSYGGGGAAGERQYSTSYPGGRDW